eukprot:jgi/Mesvir1/23597/Mv18283-RA.1
MAESCNAPLTYNGCKWKGGVLRVEKAKEHYPHKIVREKEELAAATAAKQAALLKRQQKEEAAMQAVKQAVLEAEETHKAPKLKPLAPMHIVKNYVHVLGMNKVMKVEAAGGARRHKRNFVDVPPKPLGRALDAGSRDVLAGATSTKRNGPVGAMPQDREGWAVVPTEDMTVPVLSKERAGPSVLAKEKAGASVLAKDRASVLAKEKARAPVPPKERADAPVLPKERVGVPAERDHRGSEQPQARGDEGYARGMHRSGDDGAVEQPDGARAWEGQRQPATTASVLGAGKRKAPARMSKEQRIAAYNSDTDDEEREARARRAAEQFEDDAITGEVGWQGGEADLDSPQAGGASDGGDGDSAALAAKVAELQAERALQMRLLRSMFVDEPALDNDASREQEDTAQAAVVDFLKGRGAAKAVNGEKPAANRPRGRGDGPQGHEPRGNALEGMARTQVRDDRALQVKAGPASDNDGHTIHPVSQRKKQPPVRQQEPPPGQPLQETSGAKGQGAASHAFPHVEPAAHPSGSHQVGTVPAASTGMGSGVAASEAVVQEDVFDVRMSKDEWASLPQGGLFSLASAGIQDNAASALVASATDHNDRDAAPTEQSPFHTLGLTKSIVARGSGEAPAGEGSANARPGPLTQPDDPVGKPPGSSQGAEPGSLCGRSPLPGHAPAMPSRMPPPGPSTSVLDMLGLTQGPGVRSPSFGSFGSFGGQSFMRAGTREDAEEAWNMSKSALAYDLKKKRRTALKHQAGAHKLARAR